MLLATSSISEFIFLAKWLRAHRVFKRFTLYFVEEDLNIPKNYSVEALYFGFGYCKIAS